MSGNVSVNRVLERFGLELDEADAVAFAETIVDSWKRVPAKEFGGMPVPSQRELNLALAFLQAKYPFQCCGKGKPEPLCNDCPMRRPVQEEKPWPTPSES